LDPEATGVLAIAFGEATKTIPYVTDAMKAYQFTVRLGQATNTDDTEGTVVSQSDERPTDAEIEAALSVFTGEIMQVPPKFSAVKVDGQRAYKLARDGDAVELVARPLFVEALRFIERPDPDHVVLELECGKGGYVRAIARDLGDALSCYGHVSSLRRTWSGPFDVDDGVTIDEVEKLAKSPEIDALLMPLEIGLCDLPELICSSEGAVKLHHGNPGRVLTSNAEYGDEAWASLDGHAVAVGVYKSGELVPSRVFNT
jgi:tRNA pseudouridine55 synthase